MPNFFIDFLGTAYRISNFFAQKLAVTATQAVNRDLNIGFGHPEALAEFGIRTVGLFAAEQPLQLREQRRFIRRSILKR